MTDIKSSKTTFTDTTPQGETFNLLLAGRNRWAMEQLIKAGVKDCTPSDTPAPRWAAYTHNLRSFGVPIETANEKHKGPYPRTHARYVLRAQVKGGAH
ncbi:hypothetical protein PH7735_03240 [Shimia thalassica]|uniref:Winged helix domain-containing protein n=1 Tax=Shimia thalassica TaxID=1715693 RepID=A0A0P1IEL4_9RHOB|nr:hypothetical protein [Shimia thalassica]CUK08397.1 hypothetical protein PH7735_03240 [Shimia thalassica]